MAIQWSSLWLECYHTLRWNFLCLSCFHKYDFIGFSFVSSREVKLDSILDSVEVLSSVEQVKEWVTIITRESTKFTRLIVQKIQIPSHLQDDVDYQDLVIRFICVLLQFFRQKTFDSIIFLPPSRKNFHQTEKLGVNQKTRIKILKKQMNRIKTCFRIWYTRVWVKRCFSFLRNHK